MSNMSKDYSCFESESGKTSFLAGVIDVLSDNLSIHCNDFNTMDADIFYIPNQDISLLNDVVKKRVRSYYSLLGGLNKPDTIEKLDFRLTKVDSDPAKYIMKNVSEFQKNSTAKQAVDNFLFELDWHLQKPICIYEPIRTPDKNINILGRAYGLIAWRYFFVAYEEYMVLLIFGTDE